MNKDVNCLFCKIVAGEIPSQKVYEDENVYAFNDINPNTKVHVLFVHKEHSHDLNQMTVEYPHHLPNLFMAIRNYTESNDLAKNGFRLISNMGKHGGQTVFHTHFHVLGGQTLPGKMA